MFETQCVDAGPHFGVNVDQLKACLTISTNFRALNEHAQNREIDPIPGATIDDEFASTAGQSRDDLSAKATAIRTVKVLRESNPIGKAVLLGNGRKHYGLLCLGMTQRRAERCQPGMQRPCHSATLSIRHLLPCHCATYASLQFERPLTKRAGVARTRHVLLCWRDG